MCALHKLCRYVLASGLLGFLLLNPLMDQGYWWLWLLELVPAFALYRCARVRVCAEACRQRAHASAPEAFLCSALLSTNPCPQQP